MPPLNARRLATTALLAALLPACDARQEEYATPAMLSEALIAGPALRVGKVLATSEWTQVTLDHAYSNMVVIATPVYAQGASPATVRIRNGSADHFELSLARMDNATSALAPLPVSYLVVEAGTYDVATHGIKLEAGTFPSTQTDRAGRWIGEARTYAQAYSQPVVLGQVMSANDARPSMFWSRGTKAVNPAVSSALYMGKHVGEDPITTRLPETLGYVVLEAGTGEVAGIAFQAGRGADTARDVAGARFATYSVSAPGPAASAVLSQSGMDGTDGSWPVLYGTDALSGTSLRVAVDEDQWRDTERSHATEQVFYATFDPCPSAASLGAHCGPGSVCAADRQCLPQVCVAGASGPGIFTGNATIDATNTAADLAALAGAWCVTGNLTVSGTSLTTLTALSQLREVAGNLSIRFNSALPSLEGLTLRRVEAGLVLTDNAQLTSLDALGSIEGVGSVLIDNNDGLRSLDGLPLRADMPGDLHVQRCDLLDDLTALQTVTSVAGSLLIYGLPRVTSVDGLSSLETVAGSLRLSSLPLVTSLAPLASLTSASSLFLDGLGITSLAGLEGMTTMTGTLRIADNPRLVDLQALAPATHSLGGLLVTNNAALTSLAGLAWVQDVDGYLTIYNNAALTSLAGLDNLTHVRLNVILQGSPQLADVSALSQLSSIGGDLTLAALAALPSLEGLHNLQTVGGLVSVNSLPSLSSLSGLRGLSSAGGYFAVAWNDALTELGLDSLTTAESLSFGFNPNLSLCEQIRPLGVRTGIQISANDNRSDDCPLLCLDASLLGMAAYRDDGSRTFAGFDPTPTHAEARVERDQHGTTLALARSALEFDLSVLPVAADIESATLELHAQAVTWGQGMTLGLEVLPYAGDGVLSASDGTLPFERNYPTGTLYMSVSGQDTSLDVTHGLRDALWSSSYAGFGLRLDQEWGAGRLNQSVLLYGPGSAEWDRPKLWISYR